MNKNVKKVFSSVLSLILVLTMLLTTSVIARATELIPSENQNNGDSLSEIQHEEVKDVSNSNELEVDTSNIKNNDNIYASCRLIITSQEDMEFRDSTDVIKSVQHLDNIYIVEYISPEETENAYNFYKEAGIEVEVDMISDTPEDIDNKDEANNYIAKEEIADTNKEKNDNATLEAKDIVVAVLDTGLNSSEGIFDEKVVEGKDFIETNGNYQDKDGHGTTMSRIILDTANLANLKIMPIKVLDDNGMGTTLTAYQGIKYVIDYNKNHDNKVSVINLSMSGIGQSKLLESAINEAYNNGIVVVVSAGNDNKDVSEYTPANVSSAITIGSVDIIDTTKEITDDNVKKTDYSNYGRGLDYIANGHYEYTRVIDSREVTTKIDGTSVSSAYVTSFVAMIKSLAMSDDETENDNMSNADIEETLTNSAIKLTDVNSFGRGYLAKENIVLSNSNNDSEKQIVEDVNGITEDITLQKNDSVVIWRDVRVKGLKGNWRVQVYESVDILNYDFNYSDQVGPGAQGESAIGVSGGGTITVRMINAEECQIEYSGCNISNTTPWIRVWTDNNGVWEYTGSGELDHPGNSWQNYTPEYHKDSDKWYPNYVDRYGGIGFHDKDIVFYTRAKNYKVTYDTNGGAFKDGATSVTWEYDGSSGNNWFGVGIGSSESPTRAGYDFRGWYISDNGQWRGKHTITNLVDYANRYSDLKAAFGYNMSSLNSHFWNYGIRESWRSLPEHKTTGDDYSQKNIIAEHCSGILDVFNGYDFDNYRQLLPANTFLTGYWAELCAGQNLVATAIWTPKKYTVSYNYNNGYGDKANQSCQFDSAYTVQAAPSKYKSANLVFDSNGGSAVGNVKTTKTFLGWDSDNDVGLFLGSYVDYSRTTSSAYDTTYNAARYANVNLDLYNAFGGYTGTALISHWDAYAKKEGRVCTGSGNIYDASNYYQPNRTFKNLTVSNRTVNMTGRWKINSMQLPTPIREGYDFVGWVAPDGKIYSGGSYYTPVNDNDVNFVARWKRNTGRLNYNPNGAVDESGDEYDAVTDDEFYSLNSEYFLQSGNIFGKEYEKNDHITRDIKGTGIEEDYTYYMIDKGDVINMLGTKDNVSSFQGWSTVSYATKKDYESIIYNNNIVNLMDVWLDANAVQGLGYENKPNMNARAIVNNIKNAQSDYKALTSPWNTKLEQSGTADVYAIWDEYPTITCKEIYLDYDMIRNKYNTEDAILKLAKVKVNDKEDGNNVSVRIIDFNIDDILDKGKKARTVLPIEAVDSAGNRTICYLSVVLRYSPTDFRDALMHDYGFARKISEEFYYKRDTSLPDGGECNGALMLKSVWYCDPEYVQLITRGFENLRNKTGDMVYSFKRPDMIKSMEYTKTYGRANYDSDEYERLNGKGSYMRDFGHISALAGWVDTFSYCRVK